MVDTMLWDPAKRPNASASVQYPFFQIGRAMPAPEDATDGYVYLYVRIFVYTNGSFYSTCMECLYVCAVGCMIQMAHLYNMYGMFICPNSECA